MNDERMPEAIPYIAYEGAMARHERTVKRLIIGIVIAVILLFATNVAWLCMFYQYDMVSYEQDGEGINNICTGTQGSIINGAKTKVTDTEEEEESQGSISPQE